MTRNFKLAWWVITTGALLGVSFSLLIKWGNPPNMGICAICFLRDVAGALQLHSIAKASYIRPEIIGFILGAMIVALITKDFKVTGGSAPIIRFIIGGIVGVGALVFLGCPIRMFGRIAGGDWIALEGLAGLTAGIFIGTRFLKAGFNLGQARPLPAASSWVAWVVPLFAIGILILRLTKPAFVVFGPTPYAPVTISLAAGLIVSGLAQRSRFCTIGGIRDIFLIRDGQLLQGVIVMLIVAFGLNLILGQFHPGSSPIAQPFFIWNFGSMFIVGLGLVMLNGCPFRQMVMSGNGSVDAGITVLGMFVGSAMAHNCVIAASPAGVPVKGKLAVIGGIVVLLAIGFFYSRVKSKVKE